MTVLSEEAQSLAGELVKLNPQLDGSFNTLNELEKLIKKTKSEWSLAHLRRFGAYFGEVIRAATKGAKWVDYENAKSIIGSLEKGEDIDLLLRCNNQCVFPLVKVQKFLDNGSSDSLAAFAPVAVTMLNPQVKADEEQEIDPNRFSEWQLKSVEWVDEFFRNPTNESLLWLSHVSGHLKPHHISWVLEKHTAEPSLFTRFFSVKDEPLRYNAKRPGATATTWLWHAIKANSIEIESAVEHLSTLRRSSDKLIARRSAWVMTRLDLYRDNIDAIETSLSEAKSPGKLGIADGFYWHVIDELEYGKNLSSAIQQCKLSNDTQLGELDLVDPLRSYVPILRNGLNEKNKSVKKTWTDTVLRLFNKAPELYALFEAEAEALIRESNTALLKSSISLSECILSKGSRNQNLINGLIDLADHKNGRVRASCWSALSNPNVCNFLSNDVVRQLVPSLAKPDKYCDVYLCAFAKRSLERGIMIDEIIKQAKLGIQSGGFSKYCQTGLAKTLSKY